MSSKRRQRTQSESDAGYSSTETLCGLQGKGASGQGATKARQRQRRKARHLSLIGESGLEDMKFSASEEWKGRRTAVSVPQAVNEELSVHTAGEAELKKDDAEKKNGKLPQQTPTDFHPKPFRSDAASRRAKRTRHLSIGVTRMQESGDRRVLELERKLESQASLLAENQQLAENLRGQLTEVQLKVQRLTSALVEKEEAKATLEQRVTELEDTVRGLKKLHKPPSPPPSTTACEPESGEGENINAMEAYEDL